MAVLCILIQGVNIDQILMVELRKFGDRSPSRKSQITRSKKWHPDLDGYERSESRELDCGIKSEASNMTRYFFGKK